jgi:hypothetical protein
MSQLLKIRCWECRKTFSIATEKTGRRGVYFVEEQRPCLFCQAPNVVRLNVADATKIEVYRGETDGESGSNIDISNDIVDGLPPD